VWELLRANVWALLRADVCLGMCLCVSTVGAYACVCVCGCVGVCAYVCGCVDVWMCEHAACTDCTTYYYYQGLATTTCTWRIQEFYCASA
jgi:hypothetical protein